MLYSYYYVLGKEVKTMGLHIDPFGTEKKTETPPVIQKTDVKQTTSDSSITLVDLDDLMFRHELFEKSMK